MCAVVVAVVASLVQLQPRTGAQNGFATLWKVRHHGECELSRYLLAHIGCWPVLLAAAGAQPEDEGA